MVKKAVSTYDPLDVVLLLILLLCLVVLLVSCSTSLSPQERARLDQLSAQWQTLMNQATAGTLPWKEAILLGKRIQDEIEAIKAAHPEAPIPAWLETLLYVLGSLVLYKGGRKLKERLIRKAA